MRSGDHTSPDLHGAAVVYADARSDRKCRRTLSIIALLLSFGGAVAAVVGVSLKTSECNRVKVESTDPYYTVDSPFDDPYDRPFTVRYIFSGGSMTSVHEYETHYDWKPSTVGSTWGYDDDWMSNEDEDVERRQTLSNEETATYKCRKRSDLGASMIPAVLQIVLMMCLVCALCGDISNEVSAVACPLVLPTIGSVVVVIVYMAEGMFIPLVLAGFGSIIFGNFLLFLAVTGNRTTALSSDAGTPPMPRHAVVHTAADQRAPLVTPVMGRPVPYGYSVATPLPTESSKPSVPPAKTEKTTWK